MINSEELIGEILSGCVSAFLCPRGEFYPNKNYGSQIMKNKVSADSEKLLAYARQAVSDMDGIFVKSAYLDNLNVVFTVAVNDEERQVSIKL